jgi:hypothetical protein
VGLAAVGAFTERRWSAFRILVQVQVLMLALILVAGVRAAGDHDPSNALTWPFAGGFATLLAALLVVYARMAQRAR